MIRLIVRRAAEADIVDAEAWYAAHDRAPGLPDDDRAVVIAVLHQSRAPRNWKRRANTEGGG